MQVEKMLPHTRQRLATVNVSAPLIEAASLLRKPQTGIVVVCSEGQIAGVLTKTDVVRQISHCSGASCTAPASAVMTRNVISCRPDDSLKDVWSTMRQRGLKRVPILGDVLQPIGVLTIDDALQELLKEAEDEEELLRDYVMSVGYR